MTTTATTQTEKVAQYLLAGRTLTAAQARSMWAVKNLRARMSELRASGMRIGTIPYTRRDGVQAVKYVLETTHTKSGTKRTRSTTA
jgi:hypothetical protein